MIIVVRIHKEVLFAGKNKFGRKLQFRKLGILRVFDYEYIFSLITKPTTCFVTQIRIGIALTDDAHRFGYFDGAVVVVIMSLCPASAIFFKMSSSGECSSQLVVIER